ncbi:MAG: hypothetical protein ACKO2P_19215 [Planctomycetota bacterium]
MRLRLSAFPFAACCLISICFAAPLAAHEGHGAPDAQHGLLHYVVNPSHAVPALVITAITVLLVARLRRRRTV